MPQSLTRLSEIPTEYVFTFKEGVFATLIGGLVGLIIALFAKIFDVVECAVKNVWFINNWTVIISPIIGLLISEYVIRKIAKVKSTGCGTHGFLEAYHFRDAYIHPMDTISKSLAAVTTIGFGGSAGLEGPSLTLGGGLVSALYEALKIKEEERYRFFLAGAAAGISAIFHAPLTGVLFALEIPYKRDIERGAFIDATLSSVTSYIVFISIHGTEALFPRLSYLPLLLDPRNILYSMLIGAIASVIGIAFIYMYRYLEKTVNALKHRYSWIPVNLTFGLLIGLIGFIEPRVLGTGYDVIREAAHGSLKIYTFTKNAYYNTILTCVILIVLKSLTTSLTLTSGGTGGLFIPSIYVGAMVGYMFSILEPTVPAEVFVTAGMASLIAVTNKTVLTAVAFAAETVGPSTIITMMIAATISYFASGNYSFYDTQALHKPSEKEIALRELYVHFEALENKGKILRAKDVMTTPMCLLRSDMTLKKALDTIRNKPFRVFPVTDAEGRFVGECFIEDLLAAAEKNPHIPLADFLVKPTLIVTPNFRIKLIIRRMIEENRTRAYVVDKEGRLIGIITTKDIILKLLPYLLSS